MQSCIADWQLHPIENEGDNSGDARHRAIVFFAELRHFERIFLKKMQLLELQISVTRDIISLPGDSTLIFAELSLVTVTACVKSCRANFDLMGVGMKDFEWQDNTIYIIIIQLFQLLRLSTSKAEKSNTSAKGCWESLTN